MTTQNQVIVVTGASSGFGLLSAKALAAAGHTVYASMRETEGRNAPQVAQIAQYAPSKASTCAPSSWTSPATPRSRPGSPGSSPTTAAWT
jgi:NAD(P)-dependent dehydrogenase (short-subunit alcohol dehydrogenase family)